MAHEEEEPAHDRQQHSYHFAGSVVLRVLSVLPEVPVGWKEPQAEHGDVLLEIKETLRFPKTGLLDRNSDVDAILGVDERAHDERQYPQEADCGGVAGRWHCTEARHETRSSGRFAHRHHDGHRLMRERS